MIKILFVLCGVLSICTFGSMSSPVPVGNSLTQQDEMPESFKGFDWGKAFDAGAEKDPQRRTMARQYTALAPLSRTMEQLFVRERVDAISLMRLTTKQLEIRYSLESDLKEKKKCLEVMVYQLKQIHEAQKLLLEQPPRPGENANRFSPRTIEDLADYTLELVKWEVELESINKKLAAATNN